MCVSERCCGFPNGLLFCVGEERSDEGLAPGCVNNLTRSVRVFLFVVVLRGVRNVVTRGLFLSFSLLLSLSFPCLVSLPPLQKIASMLDWQLLLSKGGPTSPPPSNNP